MRRSRTPATDQSPRRSRSGGPGGYRRRGSGRDTRSRHPRLRRIGKWTLICLLAFVALGVGIFAYAYATTPIPDKNPVATSQASVLTYSNGTTMARLAAQNRENVPLSRVPKQTREAVLAAENRTFYTDPGISFTGILRAFWVSIHGGSLQGGSTISQQYVKKTYLTDQRTWTRKFKELILTIKVERQLSKDQILERYLNTVYYGRGAYGIQTASKAYFNKDVSKLTPAEGAVLASMIRSPSLYDPDQHPQNLRARWDYVITGMKQQGWLSAEQPVKFPTISKAERNNWYKGGTGYLIQMVKDELARRGISEDELLTGGYHVQTTFNPKLMKYARQAVKDAYPDVFKRKGVALGLASVEPGTGRIVAIYGGRDYLKQQINHATTGGLTQPGSSFKPYVLATALQNGIGLKTYYDGRSPQVINGHKFVNSGGEQFGSIDLATATEHSVNTVYVRLGQDVGLTKVIDNAKKMGIQTSPWCPLNHASTRMQPITSEPLGPMDVCPLEQAGAYATFVNKGNYVEPTTLIKVTDATGKRVIYQAKPSPRKVFSKGVSADTLFALQKVVQGGTGTGARLPDRPVAGKTGTSSFNRSAWWVGTIPQLTTAVAMYKAEGGQIPRVGGYNTVFGGTIPARVWQAYMLKVTQNMKVEDFPEPAYVGTVKHSYSPPPDTSSPTQTGPTTSGPPDTHSPSPTQSEPPTSSAPPTPGPTKTSGCGRLICPTGPDGGGNGGNHRSPTPNSDPAREPGG
ncbi:MAG TPA: transglycosylase domain-containing protein [Streptosporangiales bacterium]